MRKLSRRFGKILTAAGVSMFLAVSSLAIPMEASAARAITDDIMIRNDASREAGAIGSLQEGEEVTILDAIQSADGYVWYYIQLENGNTGYVRSDLIEASDEELAAINSAQPEEQTQEPEEQEEPEEEPVQEPEEKPEQQQTQTQETTAAATTAAPAQTQDGEYDATKDPSANFRVSYDTDENGNGEWYVHNDDNGSKWKVSDLQGQEGAAAKKSGASGIWKTLAILFGILAAALAAFVLFLLKSIRDGRSKTTRGRALEAAAAGYSDDDENDDAEDEYYFDDDEEDVEEDDAPEDETSESDDLQEQEDQNEKKPEVKPVKTPDSTITADVTSESEITEIPTEEIEAAIAATTAQFEKNISGGEDKESSAPARDTEEVQSEEIPSSDNAPFESEDASEPDIPEEDEELADDDFSDEDYTDEEEDSVDSEDEDYDDEDYEDEDSDEDVGSDSDEDYEDEDYDDEEYDDYDEEEGDEAPRSRGSRTSSKGGFFGFLKKMFGTDSSEDAEDEGEDFDDYDDEPEEHEFDEFKEYPEDIDLLPREEEPETEEDPVDEDGFSDPDADTAGNERGRLSMQRVMKNVSYKEEEADFSDEDDADDFSDSLFDDDDDMEYSFISNTRNKK